MTATIVGPLIGSTWTTWLPEPWAELITGLVVVVAAVVAVGDAAASSAVP